MTRTMGDSTTLEDIPATVAVVGVYINGSYAVTSAKLDAHFPSSRYGQVFIDVNGSRPDAQVRDWETGDKSGSLEKWVIDHNESSGKKDAVIYCNRSTIAEVRTQTGSQVLGQDYFLWISTLDNSLYLNHGVIACQNKGQLQTGGHWDSSVIFDDDFWQPVAAPLKTTTDDAVSTAPKPDCRQFQNSVKATPDNLWGDETDKHAAAIIDAVSHGFEYGIGFVQGLIGTTADEIWGPKSQTMLGETITSMQNALFTMGFNPGDIDGVWGPHTAKAYHTARAACHI